MYKYLLATDGSENSMRAALYLLDIATTHRKSIEVTVLSVQEVAAWFTESVEDVSHKTAGLFKNAGIPVNTVIKEGDPGEVIAETAELLGVDHIVMGVRGLGQVKVILLAA
ncbi:hypothetical protein N752_21265 [Desulforamulus aquiferis]|nr:universal stress protein [Desulforamulus aquiferis]RYD03128.1 hypothetical protein N752_21265 [Desulforamulus aquiferis]